MLRVDDLGEWKRNGKKWSLFILFKSKLFFNNSMFCLKLKHIFKRIDSCSHSRESREILFEELNL